jgi:Glycosyltransferase like family 2
MSELPSAPSLSIIIPMNAQADIDNALILLGDLSSYRGPAVVETIVVANNFEPDAPPSRLAELEAAGARVLRIPEVVVRPGEVISFAARIPGTREAQSAATAHFDADVRVPHAAELIAWYIDRLREGVDLAYTSVGHFELPSAASVRTSIAIHHTSRWVKRVVLRVPTARGSNYAIRRELLLDAYERGMLADDLNVGPVIRKLGGRIAYNGDRRLRVLTSGRVYRAGWGKLLRYYGYRLRYNLRVLPVSSRAASKTGRVHRASRYEYDGPKPPGESP